MVHTRLRLHLVRASLQSKIMSVEQRNQFTLLGPEPVSYLFQLQRILQRMIWKVQASGISPNNPLKPPAYTETTATFVPSDQTDTRTALYNDRTDLQYYYLDFMLVPKENGHSTENWVLMQHIKDRGTHVDAIHIRSKGTLSAYFSNPRNASQEYTFNIKKTTFDVRRDAKGVYTIQTEASLKEQPNQTSEFGDLVRRVPMKLFVEQTSERQDQQDPRAKWRVLKVAAICIRVPMTNLYNLIEK